MSESHTWSVPLLPLPWRACAPQHPGAQPASPQQTPLPAGALGSAAGAQQQRGSRLLPGLLQLPLLLPRPQKGWGLAALLLLLPLLPTVKQEKAPRCTQLRTGVAKPNTQTQQQSSRLQAPGNTLCCQQQSPW